MEATTVLLGACGAGCIGDIFDTYLPMGPRMRSSFSMKKHHWLVVSNMFIHFLFSKIYGIILEQLTFICFKMVKTTNQINCGVPSHFGVDSFMCLLMIMKLERNPLVSPPLSKSLFGRLFGSVKSSLNVAYHREDWNISAMFESTHWCHRSIAKLLEKTRIARTFIWQICRTSP